MIDNGNGDAADKIIELTVGNSDDYAGLFLI